jgi:hypothetical protein
MKKTMQKYVLIFTLFTCTGSYVLAPGEEAAPVESPEVTDARKKHEENIQKLKDKINIIRDQKEKLDELERNTDKNDPAAAEHLEKVKKLFESNAKEAVKMYHDFIKQSGIKLEDAKKRSNHQSLSKSATAQPDAGITAMSFEDIVKETPLEKAQRHFDTATKDLSAQESYLTKDTNPSNKAYYEKQIISAKAAIATAETELKNAQSEPAKKTIAQSEPAKKTIAQSEPTKKTIAQSEPAKKTMMQRLSETAKKIKEKLSTKKPSPEDSKQPTKKEGKSWVERMKDKFKSKNSNDEENWVTMNPTIQS